MNASFKRGVFRLGRRSRHRAASRHTQGGFVSFGRALMQVMWPSFLGAAIAVGVFFSAIDPQELNLVGMRLADSRAGAYTVGFFVFWLIFAVACAVTWFLASTDTEAGQDHRAMRSTGLGD